MDESTKMISVLLVEDEPDLRSTLGYNLTRTGYEVTEAENGRHALELVKDRETPFQVVISDIMMPELDGITLAKALRDHSAYKYTPLMFLTAKGETADRLEGFRAGADDYLTKPFDLEELLARVQVLARRAVLAANLSEPSTLPEKPSDQPGGDLVAKVAQWEQRFPALAAIRARTIVGQSPKMLMLLREILIRAPGNDPVLVVGETGTGKTGIAEALFRLGPRADKPFRVINCAELTSGDPTITLGKLFGIGSESGLQNIPAEGIPGLLEDVDGGTLVLDEIHRLPPEAQSMLLHPIEHRPFHAAAGRAPPKTVDVKFIFATNADLRAEADAGRFPFDLFQRLASSLITVPPLRERKDDILALAEHFLLEAKADLDIPEAAFAPSLVDTLLKHEWPGNVRELRAFIRECARRAAFDLDTILTHEHAPTVQQANPEPVGQPVKAAPANVPGQFDDADGFWNEVEVRELSALRQHRFKMIQAEQALGLSAKSRTLTNHLRGMCFKALVSNDFDIDAAALLVVGRVDDALADRMTDRMSGYLGMVDNHVAQHTTKTLFNNLPKDYRKFVEAAIERSRGQA